MVTIRPFAEDDRRFCVRSFVSAYTRSPFARYASGSYLQAMMDVVLSPGVWRTLCYADGDVILGWCVFGPGRLGWVQVRQAFRRRSIARQLLIAATHDGLPAHGDVSCATNVGHIDGADSIAGNEWLRELGYRMRFRPLLFPETLWLTQQHAAHP